MKVDPATLSIISYPAPVLRRSAEPVPRVDDDVRAIARRMLELMHEAPGVGLAAPQVGIGWRLFVTNAGEEDPHDRVFINPTLVLGKSALVSAEEGCLSIPGINVQVRRPEEATITAIDLDGEPFTLERTGFVARVWQHEFDHLAGVLILDRMSPMDRLATRKAVRELEANARFETAPVPTSPFPAAPPR